MKTGNSLYMPSHLHNKETIFYVVKNHYVSIMYQSQMIAIESFLTPRNLI